MFVSAPAVCRSLVVGGRGPVQSTSQSQSVGDQLSHTSTSLDLTQDQEGGQEGQLVGGQE